MIDPQKSVSPEVENSQSKIVKTKLTKQDENFIKRLQSELVLKDERIPILESFYSSQLSQDLMLNGIFREIFRGLLIKIDFRLRSTDICLNSKFYIGKALFKIKQVYTQDDFYVFESTDGNFFHANIIDFDTNGISAKTLAPRKPPFDTESNIVRQFTINNTSTSINLLENNSVKSTIVGDLIVVVNKEDGAVIVVNENLIEYINIDDNGIQTPSRNPIRHPYGIIKKISIDKNSNFLLIISEYEGGKQKLHIVNRKNLEEIQSFDDIVDIIRIDNKDDLICLDTDGKIANIYTNFDQFPVGFVDTGVIGKKQIDEVKDITVSLLEDVLANGGLAISTQLHNGKNGNGNLQHNGLITKLWGNKIGDNTLKELFDEADSEEKIDIVHDILLQIMSNPVVSAVAGITDSIESAINDKRFQLKIGSLKDKLEMLGEMFEQTKELFETEPYKYFPALVSFQSQLKDLKKTSRELLLIDNDLNKNISELSALLESELLNFQLKNQSEIAKTIDDNLARIEAFLTSIIFLSQITQVYKTELYKQTESLINYLDDSEKNIYKDKLKNLISKRITDIQIVEKIENEAEESKLKQKVLEIENSIEELGKIIDVIEEEQNLEIMKKNDGLILRIKHDLESLPKSEAEKLALSLDSLFTERKQQIRLKKLDTRGVVHSLDEYGIDTSLYYSDKSRKQIGFKIMGQRTASGSIKIEIHYTDGTIFNVDRYLQDPEKFSQAMIFNDIESEISQKDFIDLQKNLASWQKSGKKKMAELQKRLKTNSDTEKKNISKEIAELKQIYFKARSIEVFTNTLANKLNLNPRSRLELPNPKFIVLDEEKELLTKMSNGFSIQKSEQKGIDILEGPPGLGKTEICKFFSACTNREIVRVQCSKMDPSDLFFSPQLRAGETTREPAEWIKLMQKSGTIILFDEIDKLNPQSFERLHSLFDNARSIYDPQLGWIKANPDCLFVGTRNSYEKMSNPIVSRAVIIQVKAPSELNEAYKVAKYTGIEFFDKINYEEFKKLWVSYKTANGSTDVNTKKIYEKLDYIQKLIGIFVGLRQKQSTDDYKEKFEYEISYRDAEQIFLRFNKNGKHFKDIILEILVPKARAVVFENEDKDIQEKIIIDVVGKFF